MDLHADYTSPLGERRLVKFGIDMFNVGNRIIPCYLNQNEEVDGNPGLHSPDFLTPTFAGTSNGYSDPFNARLSARFEF